MQVPTQTSVVTVVSISLYVFVGTIEMQCHTISDVFILLHNTYVEPVSLYCSSMAVVRRTRLLDNEHIDAFLCGDKQLREMMTLQL